MDTAVTQIKINLPLSLKNEIKARADRLGLSLATYVKYLMVEKAEKGYPVFEASDRVKKKVADSVGRKGGVEVKNIGEFFGRL